MPTIALALLAAHARAQFTTVIDVPPDAAPSSIDSNTQVNLFDGGVIPNDFVAGNPDGRSTNVEVNVFGGVVGDRFRARRGSTINIHAGLFGGEALTYEGSTVNLSGGTIQRSANGFRVRANMTITGGTVGRLSASSDARVDIYGGSLGFSLTTYDSDVTLFGGEFRLDGAPLPDLENDGDSIPLDLPDGSQLSGVLSDGTPFAFARDDHDILRRTNLTLTRTNLAPIGPNRIIASSDPIPLGIRGGQTLVVDAGAALPDHFNAGLGSTLQIEPGSTVGEDLDAAGAVVNITGGSVGQLFTAFRGTTVNLSGGMVGNESQALDGSTVILSGGGLGRWFTFHSGSALRLSGGTVGDHFETQDNSSVRIFGRDFRFNGVLIDNLVNVGDYVEIGDFETADLLTGTLEDGTPFAFSEIDDGWLGGEWVLERAATRPIGPSLITASTDPVPLGIRAHQLLLVDAGASVGDDFNAGGGSAVEVQAGGSIGDNLEAVSALVSVRGGHVGDRLDAFGGSVVNVFDGTVGDEVDVFQGGSLNVFSGNIGQRAAVASINVYDGGEASISGGSIVGAIFVRSGGILDLRGGVVGDALHASSDSQVHLTGSRFAHNGMPISGLLPGETITWTDRTGTLTGILSDGSPFAFQLGYSQFGSNISHDALLTITRIPEPASWSIGIVLAILGIFILRRPRICHDP